MGSEVVSRILKTDAKITLLGHDNNMSGVKKKSNKIKIFKGDITKDKLNLSESEYKEICKNTTHIIHSASITRFELPYQKLKPVNVDGVRNIIKLASSCKNLEKMAHFSTVYVSGKRKGLILEKERAHNAGFVNAYEKTKYEAEGIIEKFQKKLPITTYRFSTVIGNGKSGKVNKFGAIHYSLRLLQLGMVPVIPGDPNNKIDIISTDDATEAFYLSFLKKNSKNKVYHICAGKKSPSLREFIGKTYSLFRKYGTQEGGKPSNPATFADFKTYELFKKSVQESENPIFSKIIDTLSSFSYQLYCPKIFDQKDLLQDSPESQKAISSLDVYYDKIIKYCINSNWRLSHGKN